VLFSISKRQLQGISGPTGNAGSQAGGREGGAHGWRSPGFLSAVRPVGSQHVVRDPDSTDRLLGRLTFEHRDCRGAA
jgi:hypothetical protein